VGVKETAQGIVFLRRVEAGEASRSYGIEVARLAGLPRTVIERAREVLKRHEQAEARTSTQLEGEGGAGPMQLTLYTPLAQQVADRVATADLDRITPLEAMNLLAELKQSLKSGQ